MVTLSWSLDTLKELEITLNNTLNNIPIKTQCDSS